LPSGAVTSPSATRRPGRAAERTSWRERRATVAGLQWFAAVGVIIWLAVHFGWVASDNAAVIGLSVRLPDGRCTKGREQRDRALHLVMGGIYGAFSPRSKARGSRVRRHDLALARRRLGWRDLYEALLESARTTSMLFVILIAP